MGLGYFKGKVVSVLTNPINRNFKDEAAAFGKPGIYPQNLIDHFVGVVEEIDSSGIMLRHPVIGTKSWFSLKAITGLIEEQYTEDPEVIAEIKKKREESEKTQAEYDKINNNVPNTIPCPNCKVRLKVPDVAGEVMCPACQFQFSVGNPPKESGCTGCPSKGQHVDLDYLESMKTLAGFKSSTP
jgi:hypothetical protein